MVPQPKDVDGLTIAVQRPSSPTTKPPVLLIHGMFGGAWYWDGYQELLARRGFESHAINLRGHHGSRPVRDIGKVSLRDYVHDALDVARSLGNPLVIGHSMGGLIAQKVAEAGACRAMVLLASAPPRWIPPVSWLLLRKQVKYVKALLLFRPVLPDRGDADALMFNRTPVNERDRFFSRLIPESGKAAFELSFGVLGVKASRVSCPVLVVGGTADHFVVPRVARALAKKYDAPLRTYVNFAHHIMCEPGWDGPATDIAEWLDAHA
ncbi:MAG TPA: alpha/beta fold hydrolase [Gemmatimonadaceae bacterium]|nr:alpha/beta fold hydrolase [Gemmatimonadaceae bacterium]